MIRKTVIITNYETLRNKLESGSRGHNCTICKIRSVRIKYLNLLNNNCHVRATIIQLSNEEKYSNKEEVKKIYRILEKSNCVGKR